MFSFYVSVGLLIFVVQVPDVFGRRHMIADPPASRTLFLSLSLSLYLSISKLVHEKVRSAGMHETLQLVQRLIQAARKELDIIVVLPASCGVVASSPQLLQRILPSRSRQVWPSGARREVVETSRHPLSRGHDDKSTTGYLFVVYSLNYSLLSG